MVSDSSSEEDSDSEDSFGGKIHGYLQDVGTYLRVTKAPRILRRYFAMNAFDGAMTSLGVVIGSYITGISDPRAVIGVIIISGIAMGISGFSGTYMTESAERSKALDELEEAMLVDLDDTIYGQASRFVSVFAAIVDGSAPFLASLPSVMPFALGLLGIMSIEIAFQASMGASLAILFLLGVFLGRVSRTNIVYSGIKMVVAGVVVAVLALLLNGGR
jgi:predicted membrane protein (TIGR00267 family)